MRLLTMMRVFAISAVALGTPLSAHADCYSDCMGPCGRSCSEAFVAPSDQQACLYGCRGGCNYVCEHSATIG
jgi:hypothetical protein